MSSCVPHVMREPQPPGPQLDCFTCDRWKAGSVVLRGNTQGRCDQHHRPAGANDWCPDHTRNPRRAGA